MKYKGNKIISLLLALFFMMSFIFMPSVVAIAAEVSENEGVILEEGFKMAEGQETTKNGKVVPTSGWKIIGDGKELESCGGYTTNTNFGKEPPSLKLSSGVMVVESPSFKLNDNGKFKFWAKANGSPVTSTLKVEYYDGTAWNTLDEPDISKLTTPATLTEELPKEATKIKLTFTKNAANLALDDLVIECLAGGTVEGGTEPSDSTMSIAKAREAVGEVVTVKGTVNFNDRGSNVHFQDDTAGIDLYLKDAGFEYTVGQVIKVTGEVKEFNNLVEIEPKSKDDVELVVAEGSAPKAKTLTISELLKGNHESQLVRVERAVIDVEAKTLTQGSDVLPIYYVPSDINVATGDVVNVEGVMGRYKDTIQIYGSSCTFTKASEDPSVMNISDARALEVGTETTVQGVVTFNDRNQTVHIQDSTAGIAIYRSAKDLNMTSGQTVKVKGKITAFNQLVEIVPADISDVTVSDGTMPEPKLLTISELLKGNNDSELVKIKSAVIDVENKTLTQGEDQLTIYYIPSDIQVKTGDTVDVVGVMGRYGAKVQIYGSSCTFTKSDASDTEAPIIEHTPVTTANINEDLKVTAKVTDNSSVSEVNLYFRTVGDENYTKVGMTSEEDSVYSAVIFKKSLSEAGLEYYIEASDGTNISRVPEKDAYSVEVSDKDTKGPEVIDLTPAKGSSVGEVDTLLISASFKDISGINADSIKLLLDDKDVTYDSEVTEDHIKHLVTEPLSDGTHKVNVHVEDKLGNASDIEWTFRVGSLNHYFGQLHSHTNISDGAGSLDEAYEHVISAGADYYAVTDHSNWFDNDTSASLADGSCSEKWTNAHKIADKYNNPNSFTAIYGYEMTWSKSTGFWGHINTFNTPGFETRNNKAMDLPAYYKALQTQPQSVSQLNHPGKTFGDFADFGYYSTGADAVVNLVEVGNGEGPIRGTGYFPSYEYYTRALDKGWHVAPTNNQDNHKGNWLTSNTARTVILASQNTRDDLYEAIRSNSVYATEDSNMVIDYSVNGKVMGNCLPKDGQELNFKVNISDDDPIRKVSIIANGGVEVISKDFGTNDVNWEFTLNPDYTYYYVRIDQEDQDIAVTAPVWVGETEKVGVSKVSFDKTLVTPGDEVEASAELFNNENTALSNIKVEFYLGDVDSGEKLGETTIDSLGTLSTAEAKIKWTPKNSGDYTVWAKATINVNGTEKVYTAKGNIKVTNKELVQTVVIDGYHNNGYVSGYYADSMNSLRSYLESRSTKLVLNTEKITDETLKDASIFILTVPQSYDYKDKTTGEVIIPKSKLDESEIAAVKKYVDNGGNLILSTLADYRDGSDEYSKDKQLNPILEAIGSQLRANDDEVIDNTEYSNQAYRLYFDNFAKEDTYGLLKGVEEGVDKFSFYSGASVVLADGASGDGVEFVVKGHETTETMDADGAGDNIPVEKGNVNALGAEQLKNGGKVIVSGTIFYSDYEISEEATKQYCNRDILENILEWMAPEKKLPVTNIAELRVDKDNDGVPDLQGQEFTVEGIVTSQSEAVEPKNAFFEVIYVQDATGGICVFGVSSTALKVGQKVRVTGNVSSYQGEFEIDSSDASVEIIDESINPIEPELVSTNDSMTSKNGGRLVRVQGKVERMDGSNLYINDGTGTSRVYVEGYIWDGINQDNIGKWNPDIKVGDTVSAVGLGSYDPEGARLRVRNTSEIVLVEQAVNEKPVISGADDITIKVGEEFDPMAGVTAFDAEDGDITSRIQVSGAVDTSKAGEYKLIYTVTDSNGDKATVERTVTVEENEEPEEPEDPWTELAKALLDALIRFIKRLFP